MTDESWRDGPPPALQLMMFRQFWDDFNETALKQVKVPAHITLETVGKWLGQHNDTELGGKYTVLSVGIKDVFEISQDSRGLCVAKVESTVY